MLWNTTSLCKFVATTVNKVDSDHLQWCYFIVRYFISSYMRECHKLNQSQKCIIVTVSTDFNSKQQHQQTTIHPFIIIIITSGSMIRGREESNPSTHKKFTLSNNIPVA